MGDAILDSFLARSHDEAMALAASSDLLDLEVLGGTPPRRFIAHFRCTGLIYRDNAVQKTDAFAVGYNFPLDYLRSPPNPLHMITWLGPHDVHHPNVRAPFICLGKLARGTRLVDLLYQTFDLITYQSVTMVEHDALNAAACVWARQHVNELPIDPRPLKWRRKNNNAHTQGEAL